MAKKDYQITIYQVLKKMHYRFFWNIRDLWKKKVTGLSLKSKILSQVLKVQIGSYGLPGLIGSHLKKLKKKTGYAESDVIKIMRRSLKPSSFRLWRKRVHEKSIKHRKKFEYSRKQISSKIKKGDYL